MARDRDERDDDDDEDEDNRPRRRRRDEEDEEDEYEAPRRRSGPQTTNPGMAKAAAILWIILGFFGTVFFGLGATSNPNLWSVIYTLAALAFLITGIQTLLGAVTGILAAGIFSIILSLVLFGFGFFILFAGAMFVGVANAGGAPVAPAGLVGSIVAAAGLILVFGGLLMLISGILAIISNKQYKAWLAYKKTQLRSGKSRRRQEYDDEEEEEERPRKRRPRSDDDD